MATSGPTRNSRIVGPSTHNPWTLSWKIHAFPCFLQLLDNERAEDSGLSKGTAGPCWAVRVPHRGSLWGGTGTAVVHGYPFVLNGGKIVEALLLQSIEGEYETSPMLEEEATLLVDIEPDIKPDIEAPQIPEQLEIHEQAQPAEQTVTPTASLPSPPSPPSPLLSLKANKPWSRATGADAIGATQWVHSYLEENYRVPEWWREFRSLLQCPSDPTI